MKNICRQIPMDNIVEGMILGSNIYDNLGNVLLAEGLVFTDVLIRRVQRMGLDNVPILYQVPNTNEKKLDFGNYDKKIISETVNKTKSILVQSMNKFRLNELPNFKELKAIVDEMINLILSSDEVVLSLAKLKDFDSYLMEHSINICLLSIVFGVKAGYNKKVLQELALGALLCDIGSLFIPSEILRKPSKLTEQEFEIIKSHSVFGYEAINNSTEIPKASLEAILYHHENEDGTGYPHKLCSKDIPDFAKIIRVIDVFDAMTSDRSYRDKICPYETVRFLLSNMGTKFDEDIVNQFVSIVGYYPTGLIVTLNSGQKGFIIRRNKRKPVVKILVDDKKIVRENHQVDLRREPSIFITNCKLNEL